MGRRIWRDLRVVARCLSQMAAGAYLSACVPWPHEPPQPVYETVSEYTPPPDPQGKLCLINCQTNQNQCEQIRQLQENQNRQMQYMQDRDCRQQRASYDRCISSGGGWSCPEPHCPSYGTMTNSFNQNCQSQYDQCYQNCGGTVKSRHECVRNCLPVQQRAAPSGDGAQVVVRPTS